MAGSGPGGRTPDREGSAGWRRGRAAPDRGSGKASDSSPGRHHCGFFFFFFFTCPCALGVLQRGAARTAFTEGDLPWTEAEPCLSVGGYMCRLSPHAAGREPLGRSLRVDSVLPRSLPPRRGFAGCRVPAWQRGSRGAVTGGLSLLSPLVSLQIRGSVTATVTPGPTSVCPHCFVRL